MSPQFRRIHRPPLLPIYRPISITSVWSKVFERQLVRLGRFMKSSRTIYEMQCFQKHSLLIRKVCVFLMHFCARPIHCKDNWRASRRLGSYRLISVQTLIRSTIRGFTISSVLWVLEVRCCLHWHSFYQIDHSMWWWTLVEVNWLTSCQEYRRVLFGAHYSFSCTHRTIFPFWKISWSVMPMTPLL